MILEWSFESMIYRGIGECLNYSATTLHLKHVHQLRYQSYTLTNVFTACLIFSVHRDVSVVNEDLIK